MIGTVGAWGKRTKGGLPSDPELSLLAHSADVAAVTEALLSVATIQSRFERLAGRPLTTADVSRLVCFAFWHDIGKANVGFWSQRFGDQEGARIRRRAGLDVTETGHTAVVATLLRHEATRVKFIQNFPLKQALSWGDFDALALFWAAISHHGTPLYCPPNGAAMVGVEDRHCRLAGAWAALDGYDPMRELALLGSSAQTWFPEAFESAEAKLPNASGFVHAFAGIVSLADWIASNPDVGFFPYAGDGSSDRMAFARPRARELLIRMRLNIEAARSTLRSCPRSFQDVFGFAPRETQSAMERTDLGPIVALESETGSGKTEAALWRFATLFAAGEVDSMAFLLPTRVAATALKDRVEKFLRDLFGGADPPPLNCVLGVPGYTYADGQEAEGKLPDFRTLWPDSKDDDASHRRWASEHPKRSLAAAVMVGTVDQALLGALRVRHAHLRGAALLRSLLVVDEVHASDPFMTGLLQEALERHARAGGHALLLSATLGGRARAGLLSACASQPGGRADAKLEDQIAAPYPAVSDRAGFQAAPAKGSDKSIHLQLMPIIDDSAAVARLAAEAAMAGARVLVVRNTVRHAIETQLDLEAALSKQSELFFTANKVVALHHGRYAAEDRKALDAAVEAALGKTAPRQRGLVMVGTQTLEQSLDIDADLLITDLAPADVLLQRFGRLHRHQPRPRPPGYEEPRAIILSPIDGLSPYLIPKSGKPSYGFGTSYANLPSLNATLQQLTERSRISVPRDCRAIVESTVDPEHLRMLCKCWGGGWPEAWAKAMGKTASMISEAHHAKLDWNKPWPQQSFPPRGEERLKTRLGGDDRLVALPAPWRSPFGQLLRTVKIPDWMLRGSDEGAGDLHAHVIEGLGDHLLFSVGRISFRYDRLGLRGTNAATDQSSS